MITLEDAVCKVCTFSYIEGSNLPVLNHSSALVLAHPSFDTWSLGVVLYELFTGVSLFHHTQEGNLPNNDAFHELLTFTDDLKAKRLAMVSQVDARNLLSQLLQRDWTKRVTLSRILQHPFVSSRQTARMVGEQAVHDVFISYRVASDMHNAVKLYELLTAAGFKVWLDKESLAPGESWMQGFCDGLLRSMIFMPIFSRKAFSQTFPKLTASSACDNLLLEYRLALEFKERRLIEKIYPIMFGDMTSDESAYLHCEYWF